MARREKNDGKYLRLTGLWQSKSNDALWTGRANAEQINELVKKCEEALDGDSPIVFSLWENDKKESKRDPEFTIQCFVGDSEEQPSSRRGSNRSSRSHQDERDEEKRSSRSRKDTDEPKEGEDSRKPRNRTTSEPAKGKTSKRDSSW